MKDGRETVAIQRKRLANSRRLLPISIIGTNNSERMTRAPIMVDNILIFHALNARAMNFMIVAAGSMTPSVDLLPYLPALTLANRHCGSQNRNKVLPGRSDQETGDA